jgi:hypothetical protein
MYEFDNEELARGDDLNFIDELRTASLGRLWLLRVALSYGGPRWQMIAVERVISRAICCETKGSAEM